jgi:hypothetical protein
VIFWRNLRPSDLATLLGAIAVKARKSQEPAGRRHFPDGASAVAHSGAELPERPLVSGGGVGG